MRQTHARLLAREPHARAAHSERGHAPGAYVPCDGADYKRNVRTSISVAVFSPRARPDGNLALPLRWRELDPRRPLEACTVRNARERIARWRSDPWQSYWRTRQSLRPAVAALLARAGR